MYIYKFNRNCAIIGETKIYVLLLGITCILLMGQIFESKYGPTLSSSNFKRDHRNIKDQLQNRIYYLLISSGSLLLAVITKLIGKISKQS